MIRASEVTCFHFATLVEDGVATLPATAFKANPDGRVLNLFISLSGGTEATLRPVYRFPAGVTAGEDDAGDRLQFEDAAQSFDLAAAGESFRAWTVPKGVDVAVRVVNLAGGATLKVLGVFTSAL
jgi:hypothetical protein